MHVHPTLLVSRRPRQLGVDWTGARSWLGGAPRLGATPWPRDEKGKPLPFVAQIDLAEVAAKSGKTTMPDKGSLAFFIGRPGAVIFVPEGKAGTPTLPPAGTLDLIEYGGSEDWRRDLAGRPLYPFWPLDFTALDLPPPPQDPKEDDDDFDYDGYDERCAAYRAAQVAVVERHFPRREFILTPGQAFAGPPIPDWWQTAIYYGEYLAKAVLGIPEAEKREQATREWALQRVAEVRSKGEADIKTREAEIKTAEAAVARYDTMLARMQQLQPAFLAFVGEVAGLSKGRDPWALMKPEEMARLASLWARNSEFALFTENHGKFAVDYLKEEMFKALPSNGSEAFTALPAAVRELIDARRAPRPQWWFMAIHNASRLEEAVRSSVANAMKRRQDNLVIFREQLAKLQPNDALAIFRRMLGPKDPKAAALEAEIAKVEAMLADLHRLQPAFKSFVQETRDWTRGRDPWALMPPADIADLDARMKRAKEEFKDFAYAVPQRREELETVTLIAMASADERGYTALPESVRALINRDYLLPAGRWHQMFGRGEEIQGDSCAMREEGHIMLLQLTHDDLMHWGFGDNGIYQFWISPADLMARNWSSAMMTFECH
jgi:hypothetical protein